MLGRTRGIDRMHNFRPHGFKPALRVLVLCFIASTNLHCLLPAIAADGATAEPSYSVGTNDGDTGLSKWDPQDLYTATWRYIYDTYQSPGFDNADWLANWGHRFDGQLTTIDQARDAIDQALATLKNPRVTLACRDVLTADGGVGAQLRVRDNGEITVLSTVRGMPASFGGLKRGDVITEIDGQLAPVKLREATQLIRGKSGTKVRIQFRRNATLYETTLIRTNQFRKDEMVAMMLGDIAYLRPPQHLMDREMSQKFEAALSSLCGTHAAGLILDLRDSDVSMLERKFGELFVPRGAKIGGVKGPTETTYFTSTADPLAPNIPMVALINQGTTDSSEEIASCLKFNSRAVLVGEKTFGHGDAPATKRIDRDHTLFFHTYERTGPDGSVISGIGVTPNYAVSDRELAAGEGPWYDNVKPGTIQSPDAKNATQQLSDKQLRTAVTVLQKKIAESKGAN